MATKYTKEKLEPIVANNTSMHGVLRDLGMKLNGGNHSHVKAWIKKHGIDISHFSGKGWNKGGHSPTRLDADQILMLDKHDGKREEASRLRRAMMEKGVPYRCFKCGLTNQWNGQELVLQVEHRNANPVDNRIENLEFNCPNCHSQTPTFGSKKLYGRMAKSADAAG